MPAGSSRTFIVAAIAACWLSLCGPAALAKPAMQLDLPAQPLADALRILGKRADTNILIDLKLVGNLQASAIKGSLTVDQALSRMLAGTNLRYRFINERTVVLEQAREAAEAAPGALRLVQTGRGTADQQTKTSASREENAVAEDRGIKGIPEILVEGRRSANVDIQRTEDDAQPYVVFNAEDIRRSLAANLNDFLKSRLPMNSAGMASSQYLAATNASGNVSGVSLRGLGQAQTLILVNGRRVPAVAGALDFGQPDINGIPPSAVERIEVLPSTAGGIYGGGATGGVINIILKNDYQDFDLTARYDNTFDSDVGQRRIDGAGGFTLEGGRTQVRLTGSYSDSNELTVGDRDFLERAVALQLGNNRAAYVSATAPPVGATPNIRSADGSALVLKAGDVPLNSSITHVPYGYRGIASDNGAALAAGAGSYNLDLPRGLPALGRSLAMAPTLSSASINVRRTFTDRVEAFIEYSYNQNYTLAHRSTFPDSTVTLSSTAASNPFRQAIQVRYLGSDFDYGSELRNELRTTLASAGATVRLPGSWMLRGGYDWSLSENEYSLTSTPGITPDGRAALADGRLDLLRDSDAYPLDYSPYYFTPSPSGYFIKPRASQLQSASVQVAGPVFQLPGGQLALTAQVERREQEFEASIIHSSPAPNTDRWGYSPRRGQDVDSCYVEATAPLVSAKNAWRFTRALDLQLSYRHDRVSTRALQSSAVTSLSIPTPDGPFPEVLYRTNRVRADQYTVGLRYQPLRALALRASFGAGILAPSLVQLTPQITLNPTSFGSPTDPKRDNAPVTSLQEYITVGNPDLDPEQSRSWSAGMILTPESFPGLRLSLDYTRIDKSDEISSFQPQVLVNLEDSLPGRVVRADLTATDIASGYTGGVIRAINNSYLNVADTRLVAYDAQADYTWRAAIGEFSANLIFTYAPTLSKRVTPVSPQIELAGHTDGPLKWRGNGGLAWTRANWTAGWNMQYYHSYFVYFSSAQPAAVATAILNQGSPRIRSQSYHDVFVKYEVPASWLADTELTVGVLNVLDQRPPTLAVSAISFDNGFSGYGDVLMRRYSIAVRKNFGGR